MNTTTLKQLEAKGLLEIEIGKLGCKHLVGIRFSDKKLKHSVWHWFNVYDLGESNECMYFNHSYNQCTGKQRKGTMTGLKLEMKINQLIENNLKITNDMNTEKLSVTFLNGKYTVNGESVEINTAIPFISFSGSSVQDAQAETVINAINDIWQDGRNITIEEAIAEWIFINVITE